MNRLFEQFETYWKCMAPNLEKRKNTWWLKKEKMIKYGKNVEYEEKDECFELPFRAIQLQLTLFGPTMNLFTWNDAKALAVFATGSWWSSFMRWSFVKKNTNRVSKFISDGQFWKGSSNTHLRNFTFNTKDHEWFLAWECLSRICFYYICLLPSLKKRKTLKRSENCFSGYLHHPLNSSTLPCTEI